ncbi:YkoP family protein [Bacillus sp. 1P06AnD]|uniref:YkoP family protein n=1 Tax=Bacillus sp. 1P06AnD TaxID=3132208 RepID=UPI0039A19732
MLARGLFLKLWHVLDPVYCSFTRLQFVPASKKDVVLRVRLTRYKGMGTVLADGTAIRKNDLMVKIHLHNIKLLRECLHIKSELARGRAIFRKVKESMPHLTAFIDNHPDGAKIKGIIGITLINKGFLPLGFECILPESKLYTWYKKMTHIPIHLLSCSVFSIEKLKKHHTVYLMMSKQKLFDLYKSPD